MVATLAACGQKGALTLPPRAEDAGRATLPQVLRGAAPAASQGASAPGARP